MDARAPFPAADPIGGHGLFGLREDVPATHAIASALAVAYRVQHDLSDLGMSEADWARLFALSER